MLVLDENGNMVAVDDAAQQPPPAPAEASAPLTQTASLPGTPAQAAAPSPEAPAPAEPAADPEFTDYLTDIPKGVWNGGVSAVQETAQFGWEVGHTLGFTDEEKLPGYDSLEGLKAETSTTAGKITEDVVALGLGFVGAGKFLAPIKALQKAGKGMALARGMAQGAMADFVVMDPVENRLSDFVQEYPTFANPITEALSSKEDDSRWEGRLKNAAEGVLVGTAFETLFWSVKLARGVRHKNPQAVQEATTKLEAATTKATGGEAAKESIPTVESLKAEKQATQELHDEFTAATKAERGVDPARLLREVAANSKSGEELLEKSVEIINSRHLSGMDDEALKLHEAVGKEVYHKTLHAQGPEKLDELVGQTVKEWREMGMDTRQVEQALERVAANSAEGKALRQDVYGIRSAHNTAMLKFNEAGQKLAELGAADGEASLKAFAEVNYWAQESARLAVAVRDAATTAGRGLRAFGKDAEVFQAIRQAPNVEKAVKDAIKAGKLPDPKGWRKKLANVEWRQMANDPRYAARVANALTSKSGAEMLKEAYISSILFGVRTNLTNTISNAAQVTVTPLFRALGNIPEKGLLEAARQEAVVYAAMARNLGTALNFSKQAWQQRRGLIDSKAGAAFTEGLSPQSSWTRQNFMGRLEMKALQNGASAEDAMKHGPVAEFFAGLVDGVGKFIQLPGRFLETQDEFFKQLAYRTEVEAAAMEEALKKYGRAKPKEVTDLVKLRMDEAFDVNGAVTDAQALNYARRMTFTQPLRQGSVPDFIQKYGNKEGTINTVVKLALPFVRTPTNILTGSIEYVPFLNRLSSHYREAMAGGGRQAAEMRGKAQMGGLIIAGALFAASEGRITGSMPRDPELRDAAMRNGWRPNSFKIGDTYVSFQRADPVSTFVTVCADLVAASPYLERGQQVEFGNALATSIMHMLEDKSYLQGIQNLMGLVSGESKGDWERFGTQLAAGFVPNFVREIAREEDEFQRDIRTISSRLQATIPGWSESLPAKYDWLTGQPVGGGMAHLWGLSSLNEDPVGYELATLGGIMKSPSYKLGNGGVEMSEVQHSRLSQLIGTIQLDGRTLHESLSAAIHSKEYDLKREKNPEVDGFRSKWLKKICTSYKKAAIHQLGQEYPELAMDVQEEKQEKRDNLETKRSILAEGLFLPKASAAKPKETDADKLRKLATM